MTFEEAEAILARVTYKPGVLLLVERLKEWSVLFVRMEWTAADADGGGKVVVLRAETSIPQSSLVGYSVRDLLFDVEQLCVRIERHEIQEWLKLDGVRFRAPHPEREERVLLPGQPL